MTSDAILLEAAGIAARFDPNCGMVDDLAVEADGGRLAMLHRAPWHGDPAAVPPGTPPHLARLAGDFFCAPFGAEGARDGAPLHGWAANGFWSPDGTSRQGAATIARFTLDHTVMGARLVKELRLVDSHPFLYQRHVFSGGRGTIAVANHAMLRLPEGGRISLSPKRWFETSPMPQESDPARGRSILSYPARSLDPRRFPRADGGTADLLRYPLDERHEDFVIGVEGPDAGLGWTAVVRAGEGGLYLSLRNARRLPLTMFWFSNRGRDYAPWNGRHADVLGVEEGVNRVLLGWSDKQSPNPLEAEGVPLGLTLDEAGSADVRHVVGFVPWSGEEAVAAVEPGGDGLRVRGENGTVRDVPCDLGFLHS